ncbi:MAG: hypothetical protein ACXWWO_02655 [Candidatus Limnocylindria bacterium]
MRRPLLLPGAFVSAAVLGLLLAAPASAAVTGTICGEVTAFTAATAVTDGSITIDGTVEVIDSSAFAAIDAGTLTTLTTVANADATTCLDVTANGAGEIIDLDVAAQARICGTAAVNTTTGLTSVAGVDLPTGLVTAGTALDAYLDAAARANASVCVDTTIDQTTGLITSVRLDATITVCGDAVLDADSATLGGVDVLNSQLDAEAEAALRLAASTGADTCMTLVVDNTQLVQANLSAAINLCGNVTLTSTGSAVVNGIVIDPALTSANAAALLQAAAEAAGTACASFNVTSVSGDTTVAATVTIDVCATVTAVTADSITVGGVTFAFAGASEAGVRVGSRLCFDAATGPTISPTVTASGALAAAGGGAGPTTLLPDTFTAQPAAPATFGWLLVLASGIGFSAVTRIGRKVR